MRKWSNKLDKWLLVSSVGFLLAGCQTATTRMAAHEEIPMNLSPNALSDFGDLEWTQAKKKSRTQPETVAEMVEMGKKPKIVPNIAQGYSSSVSARTRSTLFSHSSGYSKDNLWDQVRAMYTFPEGQHPRITEEMARLLRNRQSITKTLDRARPYFYHVVQSLQQRGLPGELALLPIIESGYNPRAVSVAHAVGIWQFIESTGRQFGLEQNAWYDERRDLFASTEAALDYLEYLNEFFNGDWMLALAGYNAGEYAVARAIENNRARGLPTDYWHLDLPRQTMQYVPKLIALSRAVKYSEYYGIALSPIPNRPHLARVAIGETIDFSGAAQLAGLSFAELRNLNPAFKKSAPSSGYHIITIPADRVPHFQSKGAEIFVTESHLSNPRILSVNARGTGGWYHKVGERLRATIDNNLLVAFPLNNRKVVTLPSAETDLVLVDDGHSGKKVSSEKIKQAQRANPSVIPAAFGEYHSKQQPASFYLDY